jgi:hypothetical protein
MNLKRIFFFLLLSVFFAFEVSAHLTKKADKELQTVDREYEENIRSILLYPISSTPIITDVLQPAIMPLNDPRTLLLSFDEMGNEVKNYYVRILNCNSDWTLSNLNAIMFLTDYDEYQIFDRQSSNNTRMPYIHYKFPLPKTKISGNFIVMVYRDGDDQDIILTKRFMIYENNVTITPQIKFPVSNSERNTGQQVDFSISYSAAIQNPMDRMSVVVRQNNNWSNAISTLKPVYMRDEVSTYDYTFFNNENVFKGGNEFRFFDLRNLKGGGMNVNKITYTANKNEAILTYDKSRVGNAYSTMYDINGSYSPEQYDTKLFEIDPDYALVTFTLDMKQQDVPGRVFIMGALSDWELNADFEMKWDPVNNFFTCTVMLKQGYYNYCYVVLPKGAPVASNTILEGSFAQTQNYYDIIVYYRGPGAMYDAIAGYKSVNYLGK